VYPRILSAACSAVVFWPSGTGVAVLGSRLGAEHDVVVFPLGSNDSSPDALAASLEAAASLAGPRCLVVATIARPPLGGATDAVQVKPGKPISGEPTHIAAEPPTLMGAQVRIEDPVTRSFAKPAIVTRPEEVDPEIVEIFLEESKEEINSLRDHFPRWREHPDMKEELTTVRRSFHTLKGSGRMVGAEMIGEFAWSMENMLNRVLDQTVSPGSEMFNLLERAIRTLPELIEQLVKECASRQAA